MKNENTSADSPDKILEKQALKTREKYSDIIDLDRPDVYRGLVSSEDRAAQFSPFHPVQSCVSKSHQYPV